MCSLSLACLCQQKDKTRKLHSVKRLSRKTEGIVVIPRSKFDPYQDDLLCVRVLNSSHNGFSSCITAKCETLVSVLS